MFGFANSVFVFFVSLCVWENLFERLGKNFKKPAIIIFAN